VNFNSVSGHGAIMYFENNLFPSTYDTNLQIGECKIW
jgi:hypothetical protein